MATSPGKIVKVSLAANPATKIGSTLTLAAGENLVSCGVFDADNSQLIVGTATNPALLVLVSVSGSLASTTLARVGSLNLTSANATGAPATCRP